MVFIKKKNKKMSVEDVMSINELLKTGLSLKLALDLIKNKSNEEVFTNLIKQLDEGMMVEDIIIDYLPKELINYTKVMMKTMSFSDSLNLSLHFYEESTSNIKELEKAILYPFILVFLSLTALYLFDAYGLDSILNLLKSFDTDLGVFRIIRIILRIVVYIFYFGLLIGICLLLYFSRDKNIAMFYLLVSKYLPNSLIQTYFCEEFITLLLICLDQGYQSKEALSVLKGLRNKPIVSLLAFHLDNKLLQGESLLNASKQTYYDYALAKYINIAVYTNDFSKMLKNYVLISKERIKSAMKRLTTIIQISTYVIVGAIIIFIYQVLFLPMQAIANF